MQFTPWETVLRKREQSSLLASSLPPVCVAHTWKCGYVHPCSCTVPGVTEKNTRGCPPLLSTSLPCPRGQSSLSRLDSACLCPPVLGLQARAARPSSLHVHTQVLILAQHSEQSLQPLSSVLHRSAPLSDRICISPISYLFYSWITESS